MLTNIPIRNAFDNLSLTRTASATVTALMMIATAQAGHQYGANNNSNINQHGSAPRVSYSAPATHSPAPSSGTRPASAPPSFTRPSAPNGNMSKSGPSNSTMPSRPTTPATPTPTNTRTGNTNPTSANGRYVNVYTPSNTSGNQRAPSNSGWNRSGNTGARVTNITNTTTYVNKTNERPRMPENSFGGGRERNFPANSFEHGREHFTPERRDHSFAERHERFIPERHFRQHFGREHEFHVTREIMASGYRRMQFGGAFFGITQPWPVGWMATDSVYIDYTGGAYFLCNRMHPTVRIPVTLDQCSVCEQAATQPQSCDTCGTTAPVLTTNNATCSDCAQTTTLSRGQSISEVVAILGTPTSAVDLGSKQIYLYQNMKVVFIDGRMTDVI